MPDKIQTLRCQHGDGHEWTRPSQRGKPPRFCPEHQPVAEAPQSPSAKSESDKGSSGAASGGNQDASQTGAAASGNAPVNLFVAKAQQAAERAKMAKLREAKAQKSVTRGLEDREAMRKELAEIDGRISKANESYEESLEKASRAQDAEGVEKEFNKSDRHMNIVIQLVVRKRTLQQALASDAVVA